MSPHVSFVFKYLPSKVMVIQMSCIQIIMRHYAQYTNSCYIPCK